MLVAFSSPSISFAFFCDFTFNLLLSHSPTMTLHSVQDIINKPWILIRVFIMISPKMLIVSRFNHFFDLFIILIFTIIIIFIIIIIAVNDDAPVLVAHFLTIVGCNALDLLSPCFLAFCFSPPFFSECM